MQGFNMGRYVPPDLEGTTSFNAASGKGHALGARARKLKTSGILVVRFECPFAIWCTHCQPEQIIGQGVRFNAEKKKVGNYYSTPIWSFTFKHTVCGQPIEVHTDPKNAEYVVVSGGRRRDTGVDKILDGEIRIGASEEDKERMERDGGLGVLEKKLEDKRQADTQKRRLEELVGRSERDWNDPYEMNRKLRREFRVGRRQRQKDEKTGLALQDKFGLEIEMLAPNEEDAERVAFVEFGEDEIEDTSSKPMFAEESVTHASKTAVERGKRGIKAGASMSTQKDALRDTLKKNTRSAVDPFLAGGNTMQQPQWRPVVKRHKPNDTDEDTSVKSSKANAGTEIPKREALVGYESDSE